jgi:hypothetical protein
MDAAEQQALYARQRAELIQATTAPVDEAPKEIPTMMPSCGELYSPAEPSYAGTLRGQLSVQSYCGG